MPHAAPLLLALLALPSPGPRVTARAQEPAAPAVQAPAQPAAQPAHPLVAGVSNQRAAATVRDLVALGARMGGTSSGERAAKLLEKRFEAMGLESVRQLGREQWCHEELSWSLIARIDGEDPVPLERIWPWGFSPAGAGKRIPLEVGDARSEPGPGVALLTGSYMGVRRKGTPSNVVLVDDANTIDGAWPVCRSLRRRGEQATTFGISAPEGARLRVAIEAGKAVELDWSLETVIKQAAPVTVVATLPAAKGAPAGHFLVCAHGDSDSGGPGANDNASGVAIVLEIAEAWSAAVAAGAIEPPCREIRFAIWGTEIASTRTYLESELGAGVLGVMNFDQAGYGATGQRLHVEPDDLQANAGFIAAAGRVLTDRAGTPGFPERWATNKSLGGTDSYVFSGSRRFRDGGLPAVTLYTSAWGKPDEQPRTAGMPGESWSDRDRVAIDFDEHYHSAGDTPENTTDKEPENMGWCARVGLLAVTGYLEGLDGEVPTGEGPGGEGPGGEGPRDEGRSSK